MKFIEVGKITKPQALKGEVRIKFINNEFDILNNVDYLIFDSKKHFIEKYQIRKDFIVVKFKEYDDINQIEKFKNCSVYIDVKDIPNKPFNNISNSLVNKQVITNIGKIIGILTDINDFGAGDIYSVKTPEGSEIMFPNVRDVIIACSDEDKIIIDETIFNEIVVIN